MDMAHFSVNGFWVSYEKGEKYLVVLKSSVL